MADPSEEPRSYPVRDSRNDDAEVFSSTDVDKSILMCIRLNKINFEARGPFGGGRYWVDGPEVPL